MEKYGENPYTKCYLNGEMNNKFSFDEIDYVIFQLTDPFRNNEIYLGDKKVNLNIAKIRLRDFRDFGNITSINYDARVLPPTQDFVTRLLEDNSSISFWWHVDQVLLTLAGKEMTWLEIVDHYKKNYPDIAQNVLSKT
mgnify:CR=1 FL=1